MVQKTKTGCVLCMMFMWRCEEAILAFFHWENMKKRKKKNMAIFQPIYFPAPRAHWVELANFREILGFTRENM